MLIIFVVVGILLAIFFGWIYAISDNGTSAFLAFVMVAFVVVSIVAMVININTIVDGRIIDQQIAMYQEENANIEAQIANCVTQYQQHEAEIFSEVAPESAVTLVALYPDLKSDALVAKQIEIYIANNEAIKELKEDKLDIITARWWVYFGG